MSVNILRIAVLDDHQIVIDGLKLLLNDRKDLQVVLESKSDLQMLKLLNETQVDIVLTDLIMPGQMGGLAFTKLLKERKACPKVLVLSMSEDPKVIYELIDLIKVEGYISKEAGKEELIQAIHTICAGKTFFSPLVLKRRDQYLETISETKKLHLTNREIDIIKCILKYYSNKQIADELFISERTVETHRKNIYRKTQTKGEASLIQFVKDKGIV